MPPAPPAGNPPAYAEDFVVGNIGFILLHEFGHAIIREFKVPLLGLEEDSADTIAAITLLQLDKAQPRARASLVELLAMAAVGNVLIWKTGLEKSDADIAVWSRHSLSRCASSTALRQMRIGTWTRGSSCSATS